MLRKLIFSIAKSQYYSISKKYVLSSYWTRHYTFFSCIRAVVLSVFVWVFVVFFQHMTQKTCSRVCFTTFNCS